MMMRNKLDTQRGSAYVEYFVAAVAFALAALWFYDAGNYHGTQGSLQGNFDAQMDQIAGSVSIP